MNLTTMIFGLAPAVAPIIGGWVHVAFGWRAVFARHGGLRHRLLDCARGGSCRRPIRQPARIPFNARNLVATSWHGAASSANSCMLALAAAINFCSLACFIGSAPAIIEKHWGMSETSYAALFLPVITGIMLGAVISRRIAGRMDLTRQVHMGLAITFTAALLRVLLHRGARPAADPVAAGAAVLLAPSAPSSRSRCSRCACSTCFRRRAAPPPRRNHSWRCW